MHQMEPLASLNPLMTRTVVIHGDFKDVFRLFKDENLDKNGMMDDESN